MVHLGDITKVDGGKIPPVHIITFGSPCQNLSLIGNRSGLAGAKSSLFYQAFRIIQEMRDATDNLYPAIAVWENARLCTSTHKQHYEQKSIMYSTSIKSGETEHFTLFHCA